MKFVQCGHVHPGLVSREAHSGSCLWLRGVRTTGRNGRRSGMETQGFNRLATFILLRLVWSSYVAATHGDTGRVAGTVELAADHARICSSCAFHSVFMSVRVRSSAPIATMASAK